MMQKISKREIIEISFIAAILVLFVYFKFIISPILAKNSELNISISQLKDKYTEMNALKSENINYKVQINKLDGKYKESRIGIPLQLKDAEIENTISTLCTKNTVTLNTLSFNPQTNNTIGNNKATGLLQLPITLAVSGNYTSIINAINDMEQDKRIFKVKDFSITNGDTGNQIKGTISGIYYYFNTNTKPEYDFNKGSYGKADLFN